MLDTKPRPPSPAVPRLSTAIIQCEVLRGLFEDDEGRMRHATVRLPNEKADYANSVEAALPVLQTEDGAVLDVLGGEYPALAILAVAVMPLHPVAAAAFPAPHYDAIEIEMFRTLRCLLKNAIRDADPSLLGQIATANARIHQRRLPKPRFDALLNVAASFGACGVAVGHGGSAVALIFDPRMHALDWSVQGAARALRELGICRAAGGAGANPVILRRPLASEDAGRPSAKSGVREIRPVKAPAPVSIPTGLVLQSRPASIQTGKP